MPFRDNIFRRHRHRGESQQTPNGSPRQQAGSSQQHSQQQQQQLVEPSAQDSSPEIDSNTVLNIREQVQRTLGRGARNQVTEHALRASTRGELLTGLIQERYNQYVTKLKNNSPRIILIGDTGLGKSQLVNIVFGFHPGKGAEVRDGGRPCTQSFTEYGPTDDTPVRIIDSKGVEKISVQQQVEELKQYIIKASESTNELDHIHLIWYFVGDRWQDGDKLLIGELQKYCSIIMVLSKCDARSSEAIRNLKGAIKEDLSEIDIVECGDPRGTRNWIPESCPDGHGAEFLEINMRTRAWRCEKEIGTVIIGEEEPTPAICPHYGNDSPFGHKELVRLSLELLPKFCRQSFLAAQRVDLREKHKRAAGVIGAFTASAAGVGYMPIPFADLPFLIALEATMCGSLIAIYGVPFKSFDSSQVIGIHSGIVGLGGAVGYFTAQVLKGIPGLSVAGSSIDMIVAGGAVMSMGIALSAILGQLLLQESLPPEDLQRRLTESARRMNVGSAVRNVIKNKGKGSGAEDTIVTLIEENVEENTEENTER